MAHLDAEALERGLRALPEAPRGEGLLLRGRIGEALCEVTPKPHTGCSKFAARVGAAALAITRSPAWRPANLRGVHLRVLAGGPVRPGDRIVVEAQG
jgi:MOSC domain-containing protein YiiM